jgi:hypothetical protein
VDLTRCKCGKYIYDTKKKAEEALKEIHQKRDDQYNNKYSPGYNRTPGGTSLYRYLVINGFPEDYEIHTECYNCNCGAYRNQGICPHNDSL